MNRFWALVSMAFLLAACSGQSAEPTAALTAEEMEAPAPDSLREMNDSAAAAPAAVQPAPAARPAPAVPPPAPRADTPRADTSSSAPAPPPSVAPPAEPPPAPAPRLVTIPSGTELAIVLTDTIRTDVSQVGDVFEAVLEAPLTIDGVVVFERRALVRGRVEEVERSGRVSGRASIRLRLTEIVDGGRTVSISTMAFVQTADSDTGRDVAIGAAGGTGGAIIGGIAGGRTGAVIGGAAGAAGAVMATRGQELVYPSETVLSFSLDRPVEVLPRPGS